MSSMNASIKYEVPPHDINHNNGIHQTLAVAKQFYKKGIYCRVEKNSVVPGLNKSPLGDEAYCKINTIPFIQQGRVYMELELGNQKQEFVLVEIPASGIIPGLAIESLIGAITNNVRDSVANIS